MNLMFAPLTALQFASEITEEELAREYKHERKMREAGITSYKRITQTLKDQGRESLTPYGIALVKQYVEPVSNVLTAWLKEVDQKTVGRSHSAARMLSQIKPEVAALIALNTIINECSTYDGRTVQSMAVEIGRRIEDEVFFAAFKRDKPKDFARAAYVSRTSTSYINRRSSLSTYATRNYKKLSESRAPLNDVVHVGIKMLDMIYTHTSLIAYADRRSRKTGRPTRMVEITQATLDWIASCNERCKVLRPRYLPTLIRPKDWAGPYEGGYHFTAEPDDLLQPPLISKKSDQELSQIYNTMPPCVLESLNQVQSAPWRVNKKVLDVVNDAHHAGLSIGKLIVTDPQPLPDQPHDIDANEEARRGWRRMAAKIHNANHISKNLRLRCLMTLKLAREFADYEKFYFPHRMDFRGRFYAIPPFLSPQGDDLGRGLLEFARGKKLATDEAACWLAIALANAAGKDKLLLEERLDWTQENNDLIRETARAPLENRWWCESDDPWKLLALIFEWAGYLQNGLDHISHVPVNIDATCSGIQHFAALSCDVETGRMVNLVPLDSRQDIYQDVCNVLIERLRGDKDNPLATVYLDLEPDRSAVKRQVMTLPYSATEHSCRQYTLDWIRDQMPPPPDLDKQKLYYQVTAQMASLVSDHLQVVIREKLTGPSKVMAWLQEAAGDIARRAGIMEWRTPIGLRVSQVYQKQVTKRIRTTMGNASIFLNYKVTPEDAKPDIKAHRLGVVPNFVHSLDASHLMLVIGRFYAEVPDGAMCTIHDSFGCHAADMPLLTRVVPHCFADLYEGNDWLAELRAQLMGRCPDIKKTLEDPPELGQLAIENIRMTRYAFS